MNIISGVFKSIKIKTSKDLPYRPTKSLVRKSIFDSLTYFNFNSVCDLFSGTGNLAYEFASRGANRVVCVEHFGACVRYIQQNIKAFKLEEIIEVRRQDAFKFLGQHQQQYDIIFADPPYDFDQSTFENIIELVFKNNLLLNDGLLIIEHSKHTNLKNHQLLSYQKRYGSNMFSFFEKGEE